MAVATSFINTLLACAFVAAAVSGNAAELSSLSENGHYRVDIRPEVGQLLVSKTQNWVIHIEAKDGSTFIPSQLSLIGGMPAHGHGFPTQPKLSRYLAGGDFLVEGVRFHMPGLWHLQVDLVGPLGPDRARFEVIVGNSPAGTEANLGQWSYEEVNVLRSLWIGSITGPGRDISNRFSGIPEAIQLGEALFFDKGLSDTGNVSCADCHEPAKHFTDARKLSFGSAPTARHAPTLLGLAHSRWFYWDGRRDSLWAQAVTPIETPGEMDNSRTEVVRYAVTHPVYGLSFAALSDSPDKTVIVDRNRFPDEAGPYSSSAGKSAWHRMSKSDREIINQVFADLGKMLAAYVEMLAYSPSKFDMYVESILSDNKSVTGSILTDSEVRGLKLFIDDQKTPCLRCHNGPLFTNHEFHNIGTATSADGTHDWGRFLGLRAAMVDEFNCFGNYSDAEREQCVELNHVSEGHLDNGAFKVPGLRNVYETAPYMHDGRFSQLQDVVDFYLELPPQSETMHEIPPFKLSNQQQKDLIAFLGTLSEIDGR